MYLMVKKGSDLSINFQVQKTYIIESFKLYCVKFTSRERGSKGEISIFSWLNKGWQALFHLVQYLLILVLGNDIPLQYYW